MPRGYRRERKPEANDLEAVRRPLLELWKRIRAEGELDCARAIEHMLAIIDEGRSGEETVEEAFKSARSCWGTFQRAYGDFHLWAPDAEARRLANEPISSLWRQIEQAFDI